MCLQQHSLCNVKGCLAIGHVDLRLPSFMNVQLAVTTIAQPVSALKHEKSHTLAQQTLLCGLQTVTGLLMLWQGVAPINVN